MNQMGSFYGQPAFQRRFGVEQPDGRYIIPANWQTGIQNSITVGVLIGLCICGYCQERFGSRRTYMAGMIAMIGTIFIPVFSTSLGMLLAGSFLMGIPWGIFRMSIVRIK
jgi:SP family general alpha glucoside:H+ symporter-like MFS transporter